MHSSPKCKVILLFALLSQWWSVNYQNNIIQKEHRLSAIELEQKALGHARSGEAELAVQFIDAYLAKTGDLSVLNDHLFFQIQDSSAYQTLRNRYRPQWNPLIILYILVSFLGIYTAIVMQFFRRQQSKPVSLLSAYVITSAISPNQALDFNISQDLYDANGNIESYTLTMYAILSGSLHVAEDFLTISSFPATLNLTAQSIADALGIAVTSLDYGDKFYFTAKVTRNDGVVFYGQNPTYDADTGTVGLGNTEGQLTNVPAYKSAMNFNFLLFVNCPPVPGTYELVMHDSYGDGWQGQGIRITIDGVPQYHALCDYWGQVSQEPGCYPSYSLKSVDINIAPGTQEWIWDFLGDSYPSEVSFELFDSSGAMIYSISSPDAGQLYVINCL